MVHNGNGVQASEPNKGEVWRGIVSVVSLFVALFRVILSCFAFCLRSLSRDKCAGLRPSSSFVGRAVYWTLRSFCLLLRFLFRLILSCAFPLNALAFFGRAVYWTLRLHWVTLRSKPSINCTHFGLFGKHIAAVISIFLPCSHLRFTFFCPCVSIRVLSAEPSYIIYVWVRSGLDGMDLYLKTKIMHKHKSPLRQWIRRATVQPASRNFNNRCGNQGKSVVRCACSATIIAMRLDEQRSWQEETLILSLVWCVKLLLSIIYVSSGCFFLIVLLLLISRGTGSGK